MKRIFMILLGTLALSGTLYADGFVFTGKDQGISVKVAMDGNLPKIGENTFTIILLDQESNPITDSKVKIEYSMPPVKDMPPMNYRSRARQTGDSYRATVNLSMPGQWTFQIIVLKPTGTLSKVSFSLDLA